VRQCLGFTDKLPHFTTLQKFSTRSQVVEIAQRMVATLGESTAIQAPQACEAAMGATGLERTTVSDYFLQPPWTALSPLGQGVGGGDLRQLVACSLGGGPEPDA
jgi:hypothetical protein